jgi:hypothetical protein
MQTSDDNTPFTCANPPSATPFLRRLRMRERLHFLLILAACVITVWIAPTEREHLDRQILASVMLWLGAFGLIVCTVLAVSVRLGVSKMHIFREQAATLYLGGFFTVQETVAAKKIQTLQAWPVSYNSAQFCLLCVICKHIKEGRYAGVFPIYFCVETADAPQVMTWARDRHIDVEEKELLTSPAKLPLFIKK